MSLFSCFKKHKPFDENSDFSEGMRRESFDHYNSISVDRSEKDYLSYFGDGHHSGDSTDSSNETSLLKRVRDKFRTFRNFVK